MDTKNEIRIGTPHDHGNHAMSKMGSIFIGRNTEGKRTLMCLECGTTWTIEDGKAPIDYWVCRGLGCNRFFKVGFTPENGPAHILSHIDNLWKSFTSMGMTMTDHLSELYGMVNGYDPLRKLLPFPGSNGSVEVSWEDELEGILKNVEHATVKPNHFGTKLALNTIRHYVAHLWKWFQEKEDAMNEGMKNEDKERKRLLKKIIAAGMPQDDPKAFIEPLVDAACYMLGMAPIELLHMRSDHNEAVCNFHRAYKRAYKTGLMNPCHVNLMEEMFYRFMEGRSSGRLELPSVEEWEKSLDTLSTLAPSKKDNFTDGLAPTYFVPKRLDKETVLNAIGSIH